MSTPDSRSANFFSLFRRGQHHSKTWSLGERLAPVFVESRVIKIMCYAIRFMPPIIIFILCWQIVLGGRFGPAVATALFALSLPIQGLWRLGRRSVTPLPPAILNWFYDVHGELRESGRVLTPVEGRPGYQALTDMPKRASKQLDKAFPDDLQLTPGHAHKRRHAQLSFFSPQQSDTGVNNGNDQCAMPYLV